MKHSGTVKQVGRRTHRKQANMRMIIGRIPQVIVSLMLNSCRNYCIGMFKIASCTLAVEKEMFDFYISQVLGKMGVFEQSMFGCFVCSGSVGSAAHVARYVTGRLEKF